MKNTYFKELVEAEMTRLQSLRVQQEPYTTIAVSNYRRYTNKLQKATLRMFRRKTAKSFFGFAQVLRFISL